MSKGKVVPIRGGGHPVRASWAQSYGTLIAGQSHIDALDACIREHERVWGVDRLPTLVDGELAGRFHVQRYKVNRAIWEAGDVPTLQSECERMQKAWRALAKAARVAGALPLADITPDVWETALESGELLVIARTHDDFQAWSQTARGGRRAQVWTLEEIVRMVDGQHFVQSVKRAFEGAAVTRAKPALDPLAGIEADQALDDPIPF
jgi:hypothetical protein